MSTGTENGSDWSPGTTQDALRARAELLGRIRGFFADHGVLEVETPVLSAFGNSDPGIRQWSTRAPVTWLRTSPEYAMKRLLASGSGDIYELGRVFRADESGRRHNREFTMLEWYRVGWNHHRLMDEVSALLRHCLPERDLEEQRLEYRALFQRYAGLDPFASDDDAMRRRLAQAGAALPDASRNECLDLLLSVVIQPQLDARTLTFVHDFPEDQAALARIRPGDPPLAERFEAFLGPMEIANGYHELTDAQEQAERFQRENAARAQAGLPEVPIDQHLLSALRHGLPECAGVAVGVDRLLMAATDATSLNEVITFCADRA